MGDLTPMEHNLVTFTEEILEERPLDKSVVEALRWIDRHTYEELQSKIIELHIYDLGKKLYYEMKDDPKNINMFRQINYSDWYVDDNSFVLSDGLNSKWEWQRKRFERLMPVLKKLDPYDCEIVISCLQRAKPRAGRRGKEGIPSDADRVLLKEMRPLIFLEGRTKTDAARKIAEVHFKQHMVESAVKRLVRGWNWKMSRRQCEEEK